MVSCEQKYTVGYCTHDFVMVINPSISIPQSLLSSLSVRYPLHLEELFQYEGPGQRCISFPSRQSMRAERERSGKRSGAESDEWSTAVSGSRINERRAERGTEQWAGWICRSWPLKPAVLSIVQSALCSLIGSLVYNKSSLSITEIRQVKHH